MVIPATRKAVSSEIIEFNSKKNRDKQTTPKIEKIQKNKSNQINNDNEEENEQKKQVLSLKQAKFDVFKFGIKGFSKEDQENAKIKLAVKLGAKPPKNKSMNYRQLLDLKKDEKNKLETLKNENRQFEAKIAMSHSTLSSYKRKKPKTGNSQRRAKINRGDVGHIKGHIGSFNNGVLKIKKNALKILK